MTNCALADPRLARVKTMLRALALGYTLFLLTGCGIPQLASVDEDAQAKTFATKPNTANIYIYRNQSVGSASILGICLDHVGVAATLPKNYVVLEVPPGFHDLTAPSNYPSHISFIAEAGKNYFVWQEVYWRWEVVGLLVPVASWQAMLHFVDQETGEAGVSESKLIDPHAFWHKIWCPRI